MSTIRHEPGLDRWLDTPESTASMFADGAPVTAALMMHIASNLGIAARESCRTLVADASDASLTKTGGKDTWEDVVDFTGPAAADVAALPADEKYKAFSWIRYTLKWGPKFLIADRYDASGVAVCRRIRGRMQFDNVDGSTAVAHVCATTHGDPRLIAQGNVIANSPLTLTGAGAQTRTIDWSPSARDLPLITIPARRGSSTTGPYALAFTPIYLWLCVDSTTTTVKSVTFWEQRD